MKLCNLTHIIKLSILLPAVGLLCACASHVTNDTPINTNSYQQLANLTQNSVGGASALSGNQIRMNAVKQAALTLGAQSGLAYESQKINANLLQNAQHLRTIFNFDPLILNHSILPPVLVQGRNTLNLDSSTVIRMANQSYTIQQNAKFVTAPPTWRTYLIMDYKKPDIPNKTLLPENEDEQTVWRENLETGWKSGVSQADMIFQENLARLKQDFKGMILYRKLLAEHMVTPPYVASTDLGITGDREHLNIGDRILRISALPGLQTNSKDWTPILDTNSQE